MLRDDEDLRVVLFEQLRIVAIKAIGYRGLILASRQAATQCAPPADIFTQQGRLGLWNHHVTNTVTILELEMHVLWAFWMLWHALYLRELLATRLHLRVLLLA